MTCLHDSGMALEQSWVVIPRPIDPARPLGTGNQEYCLTALRLRATCETCGEPMVFLGPSVGLPNTAVPVVSGDGCEIYLAVSTHDRVRAVDCDTVTVAEINSWTEFVMAVSTKHRTFMLERGERGLIPLDAFIKNGDPELEDRKR